MVFEAKSPAASFLERNNGLECWLIQIVAVLAAGEEIRIRTARIHCKGDAERVVNSSLHGVAS